MGKVRKEQLGRIFVYGTLLEGMPNHDWFCGDVLTIEPAVTTGRLYHLPYGFPAMFDSPDGQVFGEVMTFPNIDEKLKQLDYLEGYRTQRHSHYIRISKPVLILSKRKTTMAWVYVYPEERLEEIKRVGEIVSGGCWREYIFPRNNVIV